MSAPQIVTYETHVAVRDGLRWSAHFLNGSGFLPITFHGASEIEAFERAERWWHDERQRQLHPPNKKRRTKP